MSFPSGASGEEPPCQYRRIKGHWFNSLGRGDPLEEKMATHSSMLAWRIPRTVQPGGLQSTELQRVGHNWRNSAYTHTHKVITEIVYIPFCHFLTLKSVMYFAPLAYFDSDWLISSVNSHLSLVATILDNLMLYTSYK